MKKLKQIKMSQEIWLEFITARKHEIKLQNQIKNENRRIYELQR
jgi:hypothetical protein